MSDFIELLTTTNYDICNRLIFGVLARYMEQSFYRIEALLL